MSLSIIIVNYKAAELLIDCLTELFKDPVAASFELIIVDNASGDDSRRRITGTFPSVIWLQMDYNAGFSRANNAGMKRATGDTMLLLNGDTLPRGNTIRECYQRLYRSEYVAAGVQLLNADGTNQISGNFVMRGGLNYLLALPYLGSVIKSMGELAGVKKPHVPGSAGTIDVDWINGAFLMVKREAIDKAGLMDEDFFLYAEESEWCGRLRKVGRICLFGELNVIHLQGETTNQAFGSDGKGYYNLFDRKGLQIMLSNFVRIRKQFGVGWFLVQLFFYILEVPIFAMGILFYEIGIKGKTRYSWSQFRHYCANLLQVIGKSLIIILNKPYFYKVL